MANAMGHPEWITDPRFDTMASRRENWSTVLAKIENWTCQRRARDCEAELQAAGVPCSRYRTITEAMTDPQSVGRGLMVNVENAEGGFQVPNPPF